MIKEVVERKAALGETPAAAVLKAPTERQVAAKNKWRFMKSMSPWVPITLKGGKKVEFHRQKRQNGMVASYGEYMTRDEKEAKLIQEFIKNNPGSNVIEQ